MNDSLTWIVRQNGAIARFTFGQRLKTLDRVPVHESQSVLLMLFERFGQNRIDLHQDVALFRVL